MSTWTRVQPACAANMWNEALNKRLGTEVSMLPLLWLNNITIMLNAISGVDFIAIIEFSITSQIMK